MPPPNRSPDGFRILEHTADVGFEAAGATPGELFQQAAAALIAIAFDESQVSAGEMTEIEVRGDDYPSLLVNFLDELLYLFDTNRFASASCEVASIEPDRVVAQLRGEPREPARHPWKLIVKAVTYHALEVTERAGAWRARVFLDV